MGIAMVGGSLARGWLWKTWIEEMSRDLGESRVSKELGKDKC